MPVSVIRHEDIARLAELFDGRRLPIARSVYFAVVQLAAEADGQHGQATRKDLAAMAGVGVRTLDETVQALEAAALMHRVKRREDGLNLPNLWLLGPEGGGAAESTTAPSCTSAAADTQHTSSSTSPRGVEGSSVSGAALPLPPDFAVADDLLEDANELLRKKTKVASRIVTPEEMMLAAVVIETINRVAESGFGLGAHLSSIVGRIRERPSYDAAAHVRLIESAFRLRWWERMGRRRGRATPAVIYGNARVFEQVVQDAVDEKKGRPIEDSGERKKRFTRED